MLRSGIQQHDDPVLILGTGGEHVLEAALRFLAEAGAARATLVLLDGSTPPRHPAVAVQPLFWPVSEEGDYPLDIHNLRRFRRLPRGLTVIISTAEQVCRADLYTLASPARRTVHLVHEPATGEFQVVSGTRYRLRLLTTIGGQLIDILAAAGLFLVIELAVRIRCLVRRRRSR